MKKPWLLYLLVLGLLLGCENPTKKKSGSAAIVLEELEKLHENKDYFRLKSTFELKKEQLEKQHVLYYDALVHNIFNNAAESNKSIGKLFEGPLSAFSDTLMKNLWFRKLQNHINLSEYAAAAQTNELIQKNFGALLDSLETDDLQNTFKMWNALKETPGQEIIRNNDLVIPLVTDKVGLMNIDVSFGDSALNLIFDTGANFSVIQESYAGKLGMKRINAGFLVSTATGSKVKSDLAVAERLKIGGLTFKNVVFLVFRDEDLSFPQIGYNINGIIGFPVIRAMEEIHITRDHQLIVPQTTTEFSFGNLALDDLMPIVACIYQNDTLRFHFDTGATGTSLFPLFYKTYRNEIDGQYTKQTFHSGSAGGVETFEGFVIDKLSLKIADSEAKLDSLQLHIENIGDEENRFHGNLGQDFIQQFEKMIISFKYSSVVFRN